MSWEEVTIGACRLVHGRAEEVLPTFPNASVQLILVDPPYMGVKTSYLGQGITWDRQWKTRESYLDWLRGLAKEWQRILTPNGSLYCFASPQMAAWVEVTLSETFNTLNHIIWVKHDGSGAGTGGHSKVCKEDLMSYFPQTERILFAEQYASDAHALGASGYQEAERGLKSSLFSQPILEAMQGTHTTAKQVTEAIGAYGIVNHGGAVSNWLQGYNIPTKAHYEAMRTFFNSHNGCVDYLRREYEDLRREYEDLRRPFNVSPSVPYTDVWDFPTVHAYAGKHECEKPLALLRHMIMASSRPDDVVLDCCFGSGSTLDAARQCGRQAIGIEQSRRWWQKAQARLSQETMFTTLPIAVKPVAPQQPALF
jgi:adenine-specific DNA-methyltransferase